MDRRGFVKACVGVGGAVALGAGGFGVARGLARTRGGETTVRYLGAHKVAGPAPRGVPYVPIEARDGVLHARATLRVGSSDRDALRWHAFCGQQGDPALSPAYAGDDVLRYDFPADALAHLRPWYADRLGEPIHVDDVPGPGFAARFRWRGSITGVVLKLEDGALHEPPEDALVPPAKPLRPEEREALGRLGTHGLVAASNVCTHFCCAAGYREAEALARPRGAWDKLYCACHGAVFDLRAPVAYEVRAPEDIDAATP